MSPRIVLCLLLAMGLGGAELFNCELAHAKSGCCSHHNGVCGCTRGRAKCCDGNTSPTCRCSGAGDGAGDKAGGTIQLLRKPAGRGAAQASGVGPAEGSSHDLLSIEVELNGLCGGWSGDVHIPMKSAPFERRWTSCLSRWATAMARRVRQDTKCAGTSAPKTRTAER